MIGNLMIDNNILKETMQKLKTCIIIPTYNNAGTLHDIVSKSLQRCADIIIVNDGSTDDTLNQLEPFKYKIHLISYPKNKGKGFALKQGFKRALQLGYDYAVTLDSDGQHLPKDIELIAEAIAKNRGALIVGERDLDQVDINGKSSFANKFSNFWFWIQTGKKLKDTQTGFRAYPLKKLKGLSVLTNRYESELALLVFASWHDVRIVSVPINVFYPSRDKRISHFRPVTDFARISVLNTILCFLSIFYGLPLRIWHIFRHKKIFRKEFKPFTRRRGKKKEAATTLGRFARSLYGFSFFIFFSTFVLSPFAFLFFLIGKNTEKKKLLFHKILRWNSDFLIRHYPGSRLKFENFQKNSFENPSVVICNHQSPLDLPLMLAITPKLIVLTNDWVWNNKIYGSIIHKAEFLPVSKGIDDILPQLRDLRDRGYSILVFPEGTRSADSSILRFHQGAFYIARELGLDIQPLVEHGVGDYLPKNDTMFRKGDLTVKLLDRVSREKFQDLSLREQASFFRRIISSEYDALKKTKEKAIYFKSIILYKYAYRGWSIVSRCKRGIRESLDYSEIIDCGHNYRNVSIINSGIGVFALFYALVNKDTQVYAFESDVALYEIASATAGIPDNLHFINAVWSNEFNPKGIKFDYTIILASKNRRDTGCNSNIIHLPIMS